MRLTVLALLLLAPGIDARAQEPGSGPASAEQEVRVVLRAFYFHLSHRNWEALISHILPAKVTARWTPSQPRSTGSPAHDDPSLSQSTGLPVHGGPSNGTRGSAAEAECTSDARSRVEHATVILEAEWASARVFACAEGSGAADEFRLLRVLGRWRIVYIAMAPR